MKCNKIAESVHRCATNDQIPTKNDKIRTRTLKMKSVLKRRKYCWLLIDNDLVLVLVCLLSIGLPFSVDGQFPTRDPRWYSREGDYNQFWPNPGDPEYRTYTYNDRRYGHYQPNGYGGQYPGQKHPAQYPQGVPLGEDKFRFDPNNPSNVQTPFPGILGGWREDLQGKQRRDSLLLDRDVFVTTNYGQVQGFKVRLYDDPDPKSFYRPWHNNGVDRVMGECSVFLGIPYALPPTFEGRFKPPRPHRGWQLLQAVDFGPACPQPTRFTGATKGIRDMDEDCLYLNVFAPTVAAGVAQKYPVMVYIHGGDFIHGASNVFQGHVMAAFYNVVVVTINYRLGALGFLSTSDENSPGNYGILDQAMAVKWVYDNAEFFNGDRNSITLFGPGAGAASAGLLMVAPQTRDIVTKVIATSGSATADWALIRDKYRAQNTTRVFGHLLGCSIESSWKLVQCLKQGRSFYELGNAEFEPQVGQIPWGPALDINFTYPGDNWYEGWREQDWHFLSETPEELIQKRKFNRGLHYMTGVTMQEAAYLISQNESLAPFYEVNEKFYDQKVKELVLRYNYTLNPIGVYEAIKYMYTFWPDPKNTTHIRDQYIHMLSDFMYRAPVDQIIKLLVAQKVPVYFYVLNTTIEAFRLPEWRKVPHDSEHYFLTGAPFLDTEFLPKRARIERNLWTDNDRNMSHFFMKTYTDFARFGNPTPQQVLGLHFDVATDGELKYLNLNTTFNSSILLNFRQTECAFWTQYLPTVIGRLVPTYPPSTEFWWEPREPLQIAFWSMSVACMLLMVIVVSCCILWRNAKRQADRYYDGDIFLDPTESDGVLGIENTGAQSHPLRSRDNIYEFKDVSKPSKQIQDTSSIRSPSSLAITTQSTKMGSQSSVSAISLRDSPVTPTPKDIPSDKSSKFSERSISSNPKGSLASKYDDSRNLLSNYEKSREVLSSSDPVESVKSASTPIPSTRKSVKTSRTQLVEGVPQTEV